MKNSTLGIIILAVLLVGGGIWYLAGRTSEDGTANTVNQSDNNSNTSPSNVNEDRQFDTSGTNANVVPGTNTSQSPQPTTMTVVLSASAMTPASPTITNGTTIIFQNNDSRTHQIASDPHPAHTDLAGFDLVIPAGSSKTFTFNKPGNWGYHDHLNPTAAAFQGTITVQ